MGNGVNVLVSRIRDLETEARQLTALVAKKKTELKEMIESVGENHFWLVTAEELPSQFRAAASERGEITLSIKPAVIKARAHTRVTGRPCADDWEVDGEYIIDENDLSEENCTDAAMRMILEETGDVMEFRHNIDGDHECLECREEVELCDVFRVSIASSAPSSPQAN